MMVDFRKWATAFGAVIALLALSVTAEAQNRTYFGGIRNAWDYAYGINPVVSALTVAPGGNTIASGVGTLTMSFGWATAADGTVYYPFSTNAPITVGNGSTRETVTPSAISCLTPQIYTTCAVTATYSFAHGVGELVASGTAGLQEALDYQLFKFGGAVAVDSNWAFYGGTTAMIQAASYFSATLNEVTSVPATSVWIQDLRGQLGTATLGNTFWTVQPSTLTAISAPTPAPTVAFSGTGTWSNTTYDVCTTYIDSLGGESACSAATAQANGVASQAMTVTSPAASTGAVAYRVYAGTAASAMYALPLSATTCTLSTLETVIPGCAIGSNVTIATLFLTTNFFFPVALGVTNTNSPVPQSHTTFAFQMSALPPAPFQTNYGPFGSGAIASATNGVVTPLASFVLPAGYLNVIGRTIRVTGKINITMGASSTLGMFLSDIWSAGGTAGLGTTVCNPLSAFVMATGASTLDFSCTMTTNAVGATAVGSLQPESWFVANLSSGAATTLGEMVVEKSAAAIGSLGLFAQDQFTLYITPTVAADTTVQVMSMHVETLL